MPARGRRGVQEMQHKQQQRTAAAAAAASSSPHPGAHHLRQFATPNFGGCLIAVIMDAHQILGTADLTKIFAPFFSATLDNSPALSRSMSALSSIALGVNLLVYLLFAYKFGFDMDGASDLVGNSHAAARKQQQSVTDQTHA